MTVGILTTIAWRNLWRNTRRTLLTSLTVALGLALLLFFLGLGDGSHQQMIESAVEMGSGHLLVQAKGYSKQGGVDQTLQPSQIEAVRNWLSEQTRAKVLHLAPRVFASALASSASGASGVQLIGVDPAAESGASRFDERVAQGEYLAPGDRGVILLGQGVARKLEIELGERVVLMAQGGGSPEIQSRLFRVKGIILTGQDEFDQILAIAPLADCQEFLLLDGQLHQLAALLESEAPSRALAAAGAEKFPDLEVMNWEQALPELVEFIRIDDGGNYVFHVFLFLLISFMVLNTLLMSVLERRREFSLMDALGLQPAQRFLMVMLEAFFIAVISIAGGFLIGYPLHMLIAVYGLPLDWFSSGGMSAAGVALDPVIYSYLSWRRLGESVLWIFGMVLLLALLPARRAARQGDVKILGRV